MTIMTEDKQIVGQLLVQGQAFDLLDLFPRKHPELPWLLKEHTFEFLCVVRGFANPIIVGRNSFAIIPFLEPKTKSVQFYVEQDEETKIEMPITVVI